MSFLHFSIVLHAQGMNWKICGTEKYWSYFRWHCAIFRTYIYIQRYMQTELHGNRAEPLSSF